MQQAPENPPPLPVSYIGHKVTLYALDNGCYPELRSYLSMQSNGAGLRAHKNFVSHRLALCDLLQKVFGALQLSPTEAARGYHENVFRHGRHCLAIPDGEERALLLSAHMDALAICRNLHMWVWEMLRHRRFPNSPASLEPFRFLERSAMRMHGLHARGVTLPPEIVAREICPWLLADPLESLRGEVDALLPGLLLVGPYQPRWT